ncbi:MAG: MerR family transcriptional regulator [Candidatus Cybelea sp.]
MPVKLSIGDFSRMTFLSIKALRYYHDVGLLAPADVDRETGYRSYELSQVATAQVIRRFRNLGMAVEQIKAILAARSVAERNSLVVTHLKQMEFELERTQGIVASLRAVLEDRPAAIAIEYRSVPALQVAAITKTVEIAKIQPWWLDALAEIRAALRSQGVTPAGPQGGLFPTELFTEEVGEVTLFVPVSSTPFPSGNVVIRELPPAELAVAVHRGSLHQVDRTYSLLGSHVLESTIAIDGPIRENFIVTGDDTNDENQQVTEIGWPIFRTARM